MITEAAMVFRTDTARSLKGNPDSISSASRACKGRNCGEIEWARANPTSPKGPTSSASGLRSKGRPYRESHRHPRACE